VAVQKTSPDRILDAALSSFSGRGFEATSLDALARGLDLTKQTILHHFGSKDGLLVAVMDRAVAEVGAVIDETLASGRTRRSAMQAVVRAAYSLAGQRPELLGFMREVGRLGPAQNAQLAAHLEPLTTRATTFLRDEMGAAARPQDPRRAVYAAYASVLGAVTEFEVLRQLGEQPSARLLVRRRSELLRYLDDLLNESASRAK
jgi:AcrR family transcriptional regulator